MALSLAFLGWTMSRQVDCARAATLLEEALALFRDMGMTQLVAFAASVLAEVTHAQEDSRRAMGLVEERRAALPGPRRHVGPRLHSVSSGLSCTPRETPGGPQRSLRRAWPCARPLGTRGAVPARCTS